jgi:hypothetical protein
VVEQKGGMTQQNNQNSSLIHQL